ncbi:NAD(P)-dependent dehydrogenase [Lactobacillus bombicola]|uniref:NAD(P)-dependent dehydrogenase n=1 Tax=Lactobacillus bombicola TaxID=1505723 RepID=A0ABX9LUA7_9LACO|nr:SDR family oxidoreductase [Lactobacillus bombicola]RHW50881.1 NAD(P)-dependent dehydrogenase [Lactobacillus bombicola]
MMDNNLINPLTRYHDDDFSKQSQKYPGIQSKMDPLPNGDMRDYEGHNLLKGRHALITGGDSGIGRAVAIGFAKEGADVAIQYLPEETDDAKEVAKLIEEEGQKAVLIPADFRKRGEASRVSEQAIKEFGSLELLVMNSAIQQNSASLEDLSMDQVHDTFEVNIISMYEMVKTAVPKMKPGSVILTTTSLQAFSPTPILLDYAATKAAIANFSINLAQELAPKGIRVNSVSPGPVWTPLQVAGGQPTDALEKFGQEEPLNRAGQPDELAPVYIFLASNMASYITGQVYGVTGGQSIN